ncbi:MAG: hypothetical protein AAF490_03400 [Chloroflexota bacterium]
MPDNTAVIARTLIIIAGSRSSGKSTFINWCKAASHDELFPAVLQPIAAIDEPIYFMELRKWADQIHERLVVHVDIFTPFAEIMACTQEALLEEMTLETFERYPNVRLLQQAEQICCFTLQPPRELIFKRWLERCAQKKSPLVRTLLTQIYSGVYGDDLYERVYQVWEKYLATLSKVQNWQVHEHVNGYRMIPWKL